MTRLTTPPNQTNFDNLGPETQISVSYLSACDRFEKCKYWLNKVSNLILQDIDTSDRLFATYMSNPITDGGTVQIFIDLIEKYGILFENQLENDTNTCNTASTNGVIANVLRKAALKMQTINSKKQHAIIIKDTLGYCVRVLHLSVGMIFGSNRDRLPRVAFTCSSDSRKTIILPGLTAREQLAWVTHMSLEVSPSLNLLDQWATVTALDCSATYAEDTVYMVDDSGAMYGRPDTMLINKPVDVMLQYLRDAIDDDRRTLGSAGVVISIDASKAFDPSTHIWALEARSNLPQMLDSDDKTNEYYMQRDKSLQFKASTANHAVLVIAYNTVGVGPHVANWIIVNSLGDSGPFGGKYVCTDTWMRKFCWSIALPINCLSAADRNVWNDIDAIIHVPIWSGIGNMARKENLSRAEK